jgi:hypothetical protein
MFKLQDNIVGSMKKEIERKLFLIITFVIFGSFYLSAQESNPKKIFYGDIILKEVEIINDSTFIQSRGVYSRLKWHNYPNVKFDTSNKNLLRRYQTCYIPNDSHIFLENIYFKDTFFVSDSFFGYYFNGIPFYLFTKKMLLNKQSFVEYYSLEEDEEATWDEDIAENSLVLKYTINNPIEVNIDTTKNLFTVLLERHFYEKKLDTEEIRLFYRKELKIYPDELSYIHTNRSTLFSIYDGFLRFENFCEIDKENYRKILDDFFVIIDCTYTVSNTHYFVFENENFNESMKKLFLSF